MDESSRVVVRSRIRNHLIPFFGERAVAAIQPSTVREWTAWLVSRRLADNTRVVLFAQLSTILTAAVDDGLIAKNPCSARSVIAPTPVLPKLVPWTAGEVAAVRSAVAPRYRPLVDLGAGCGARQARSSVFHRKTSTSRVAG
jgi:hypothetical protein